MALAPAEQVEALPAWFHFGFRLEAPERVRDLYYRLEAGGARIVKPLVAEPDLVSFRCADRDGYLVEVYWE